MKKWALIGTMLVLSQWPMAQTVTFSATGGFYDEPFYLTLQCNEVCQIRYTTNGSSPTGSSVLYDSSLLLNEELYSKSDIYTIPTAAPDVFYAPTAVRHCITLRAAAFDEAGNRVGPIATQSYFIRALDGDTHGLPVMAISADSLELFDYERGILVPGINFDDADPLWTGNYYESGREWERPVNVEFYEPTDNSGINQQAGLRTHGGTCRRLVQKGMKIYARDEYGAKRFKHKFFEQLPNESFKHLVIKPFSYHWMFSGIQDHICNQMAARLNVEHVASRPMALFINGEYWGIYFLKEKPDSHYLEDHFDEDNEDYNVVENWYGRRADGDTTGFVAMMDWVEQCDLTRPEDYALINQLIDVDSFIDYYCLELFIANNDWPVNNMRCYQLRDGIWRWIFFDGDDALHKMDFDVLDNAASTLDLGWPTDLRSTLMFRKLLENDDFSVRFLSRFEKLLETEFSYGVTRTYYEAAASSVRAEVANQAARFAVPTGLPNWEYEIKNIDRFLSNRVTNMRDRLADFFAFNDNNLSISAIYPNPSGGEVCFKLWSDGLTVSEIAVYDMLGRRVFASKEVLRTGESVMPFPLPLASGLYLLKLGNQTKRFVIQ